MIGESEREMAERHIREGEARVARHEALIEELRRTGKTMKRSEEQLRVLKEALVQYRRRLALLVSAKSEPR